LGTVASVHQIIDLDTANIVAQKLGKSVTLVAEGAEDVDKDQIFGGIMSPAEEPNNTPALPATTSGPSDPNVQESGTSTPGAPASGASDTNVPIGSVGGESSTSTPSAPVVEVSDADVPIGSVAGGSIPITPSDPVPVEPGPNGSTDHGEAEGTFVVVDLG